MKRTALKRKSPLRKRAKRTKLRAGRVKRNPLYLDSIRQLPCLLNYTGMCDGIVEAAHVGNRGLGQKSPDEEAIPLCAGHHRTRRDSHHQLGKSFWTHHGINRESALAIIRSTD